MVFLAVTVNLFVPETECVSYSRQDSNKFPKSRSAVYSFVQGTFHFKLNFTLLRNGRTASQREVTIMLEKNDILITIFHSVVLNYTFLKHTNCQMCYSLPSPSEQLFLLLTHCSSDWIMGWCNTSIAYHLKVNNLFSFTQVSTKYFISSPLQPKCIYTSHLLQQSIT